METNNHLPRIEREAKEYAEGLMGLSNNYEYSIHWADKQMLENFKRIYKAAGNKEHSRAAPVVGALDAAIAVIETECDDMELVAELKHILETYKADV